MTIGTKAEATRDLTEAAADIGTRKGVADHTDHMMVTARSERETEGGGNNKNL